LILDIGTNSGSTILKFASLTKNSVYGFEPDDFNFKICQENISLNHFNNINVENIGLGNIAGTYKLSVDTDSNRGGNRISFNNDLQTYTTINVETLDAWVESKDLQNIDLIKIDVEGFEMKVLEGGKNTISKFMPKLFIELDDNNLRNVGNSAKELIDFLEDLDYDIIIAETGQRIERNYNFTNKHFDIICKRK
jgi:FkbM family methyltransferase